MATALLQSRELWIQGYHFPKVWKPTRRSRKDPPASSSQYVTTRIGICPVVIGPHIFPDARFLWVRKVDEEAEKAEKAAKASEKAKKAATKVTLAKHPPSTPPPPTPTTTAAASTALTVKVLTEIAAASPEFSAILHAVANRTATPEQHAALTQYMRAASLIGPGKTTPVAPTPQPLGTPPPPQNSTSFPAKGIKPVTPIATIPRTPITTIPTPPTIPSKPPLSNVQSAPIPPVPKITPGPAPAVTPTLPQPAYTPVTRIPPPTANHARIEPPSSLNRAPIIATPITRIPPPSTPVQPPTSVTEPATPTPSSLNPPAAVNPPALQPVQPATPASAVSKSVSLIAPSPIPARTQPTAPVLSTTRSQISTPTAAHTEPPATPLVDPMSFVQIAFELAEPGERLLIPRHTILEKFASRQGGINVLASFILTISDNTIWIPITLKLNNCPVKVYESLAKYVFPQLVVAKEMERVMGECKRFEAKVLRLQIPTEEEGFVWSGLDRKPEKKKYVRKKKEKEAKVEEEEKAVEVEGEEGGSTPSGKKRKSLVVGLKYTPGKQENEEMTEIEVQNAPTSSRTVL
jgi:hypothetical protein